MTAGDHVRALRGGEWEHAIDVGDRTVIRFEPGAGILRREWADFAAGAERVEVVVHRERVFRPPLVVARAFSRFSESAYGAMFATSEQFATWCKSGRLSGAPAGGPSPRARPPARKGRPAARGRPARKPGRKAPARRPAASKARKARKPTRKAAPRATRPAARARSGARPRPARKGKRR